MIESFIARFEFFVGECPNICGNVFPNLDYLILSTPGGRYKSLPYLPRGDRYKVAKACHYLSYTLEANEKKDEADTRTSDVQSNPTDPSPPLVFHDSSVNQMMGEIFVEYVR